MAYNSEGQGNWFLVYQIIMSSPVKGILRYLCIMICAFSLSIVLMSIGLIYEDFDENEQKIRSARKRAINHK